MDFFDAVRVLGRRWLILLIGAVLMAAAAGVAISAVPTRYQAQGQLLLLLPPKASGATSPTNPYLNLSPGLNVTASLIASAATTPEAVRRMAHAGFEAEYAVALAPGVGPLLSISTEDSDPRMALSTRDEVIRRLNADLLRIQLEEKAPPSQLIHTRANGVNRAADPLSGSKIRALAAIGGLGAGLTLVCAFTVDRHKRRRHSSPKRASPVLTPVPDKEARTASGGERSREPHGAGASGRSRRRDHGQEQTDPDREWTADRPQPVSYG
jgi:hypothetical protein